jgi:uncharacterized membrane protein
MTRSDGISVGDIAAVSWPLLALVLVFALATQFEGGRPVRILLSLAGLLVLPGYVVSLAVFPLRRPTDDEEPMLRYVDGDWQLPSLSPHFRWATALGFSVALAPVYGLIVTIGSVPYEFTPVVSVVVGLTAVNTVLALVRRYRLSDVARDLTPLVPRPDLFVRDALTSSAGFSVANLAVVLVVVLATGTLTAAIVAPQDGSAYTSTMVGTENENGELVASGYPHNLSAGESAELTFRLENHERRAMNYSVVVASQQVAADGGIVKAQKLAQFSNVVANNESWTRPHRITSTMSGDRVRLVYLVYVGEPPSDPTIDNAYRSLTIWIREPVPTADGAEGQA